ncbi:MAG: chromosomal replication initiator protein DnaA [Cyanobacteria bacterium RUI128]|nr:chromosomal replication initiator protein DnaA [Cyanobacteria bacterium RUI128]
MDMIEVENIWEKVRLGLLSRLPESSYAWINSFEPTGYTGGVFTVVTDLEMASTVIRQFHLKEVKDTFKDVTGNNVDFEIICDKDTVKALRKDRQKRGKLRITVYNDVFEDEKTDKKKEEKNMDHLAKMQSTGLNLKFKFENFVVGENSKIAYSVAKMVAEKPAEKYNPLFIYGGSGLGKTHLMQAIGHYAMFNLSRKKVKYIRTQDFVNQYINGLREKDKTASMINFRQKFKHVDILLIDDIQFIESKVKCMEELFYIFDQLQQLNKQIVITSDRLPKDIPTLPDRLRTRFEMGIVVDIQPPPYETRIEILKKWADDLRLSIKDDVFDYIAQNFTNNVRELEGAFNKVTAIAEIEGIEINLDFVQKILNAEVQTKKITIQTIAETVAEAYNVTVENLKSPARSQNISDARKYTIYLAREMTKLSYQEIADFLNKKHPTMLYSYEKVVEAADRNTEVKETIRELKQAVKCRG